MAVPLASHRLSLNPNKPFPPLLPPPPPKPALSLHRNPKFPSLSAPRASSHRKKTSGVPDEWGEKPEVPDPTEKNFSSDPPRNDDEWGSDPSAKAATGVPDGWAERPPAAEVETYTSDPPKDEDEWGSDPSTADAGEEYLSGNGSPGEGYDKLGELKRCLVDSVYGTDLGLNAESEVRAEVLEIVNQLEAVNPNPAPTEVPTVLDGNWILLYTAFSELLPLIAAGSTPLLKVKQILQAIDTKDSTILNTVTYSSPFSTISFSASASFEVRSPSRIQVQFKEGIFQPPEISSTINLPENIDLFGQKINLAPVQQTLNPIQEAVARIARTISGQPPLKVPIPGERTASWLVTTYLDEDLRISRGDGGLFVLAKEGSPLLNQWS
ncbi:hypothetical protein QJS10_CPA01g02952 [Acorus calamus]|uniref:Plastid lipid-associated protein/fibrillin conserved domain-containing protein n=1 Tax=Acorus calamus TaxID=4465 RepID=A0AAV9FIQ0_ACOCL|nr:hypothetical protein QJS10_CPA01g02952 [Acorus calamus]